MFSFLALLDAGYLAAPAAAHWTPHRIAASRSSRAPPAGACSLSKTPPSDFSVPRAQVHPRVATHDPAVAPHFSCLQPPPSLSTLLVSVCLTHQ